MMGYTTDLRCHSIDTHDNKAHFVSITAWMNVIKHSENLPMQYTEIFSPVKIENFHGNIFDIFLIFAQNIDCGNTLEPPR